MNMNATTNATIDHLEGWLREQVKSVNDAIKELERIHNYGKAAQCEGMREAYMKCLEKLST
jgi:hypothetical protein